MNGMKCVMRACLSLLLICLASCAEEPGGEAQDGNSSVLPGRKIVVETNGTSRVLIQQLDPPADLFVREMKPGERAETTGRGTCKVFCSARESVRIEVDGQAISLSGSGPGAREF